MLSLKLQYSASTQQPLIWREGKIFHVLGYITPTNVNTGANANPYVAGGDTLDLTQFFNLASSAPGMLLPTIEGVAKVEIVSFRAANAVGASGLYIYQYSPGTTLANGTMQIFTGAAAQSPLAELNAGNYPANVLNDVIQIEAMFVMP